VEVIHMQVGKRFPLEDILEKMDVGKRGNQGGASLNYNAEHKTLELYAVVPKPTSREKQSFRNDIVRFGLYHNHLLNTSLIMVKMGTDLIFDLLYDINKLDHGVDGVIEGNAFHMYMIDAETGILHGMRSMGLGENFMNELNRICKNDNRYTTAQYNEWLNNDVLQKSLPNLWVESEKIDWDK
jgi:hypothetical protein